MNTSRIACAKSSKLVSAFGSVLAALVASGLGGASAQTVDFNQLGASIEAVRAKHKLPAMGAALVSSESVITLGVAGTRKLGDMTPVTNDDLWHLGSNGKAMTATLIARLAERGLMTWDQTLGETFPELASQMSADMKSVTVTQLLSHHAGFAPNDAWQNYADRKDLIAARVDVLKAAMKGSLKSKPGSKIEYSNWGYVVASAMAERAAGKLFENLMRDEVFVPLKMTSAGFGGTGTNGKIDQPWPHTADGKPAPSNGAAMDNFAIMSAAGRMHMSLADWGKFIAEHLRGAQGKSTFFKKETLEKLHTVVGSDYALGWVVTQRGWAGGKALTHTGDNTMNFALVWVAPAKDIAVLITANQGSSFKAADEVAALLIGAYLKGK